jgi:hypothetical protein
MAEWTGQKRTLNSIPPYHDPALDATAEHGPRAPMAPGATSSPQVPGMTPDDPALPGKPRGSLLPLVSNRRPLTEYDTAQRRLRLFTPAPGAALNASDWEQGPAAMEELRKADPALVTPIRPLTAHGLGLGRSAPAIAREALEALGDASEVTLEAPPATEETGSPGAVQAPTPTGDLPANAIRGDGSTTCPADYPIKGNASSMIYHTLESPVYAQTIAEICFASPEAAQAAGYHPPRRA